MAEQVAVLNTAARFLKPGGELVYITCSILPQENDHQVSAFLERHPDFELTSLEERWTALFPSIPAPLNRNGKTVTLTPTSTDTDGFFCAILTKKGA
jgi:16S rRNA (cytosine967-C5)-methyltransferase